MGEAIGAKTIDLEWVQVHPTGLVKPDDADAKIKFLAAEAYLHRQRHHVLVLPCPKAGQCQETQTSLGLVKTAERRHISE